MWEMELTLGVRVCPEQPDFKLAVFGGGHQHGGLKGRAKAHGSNPIVVGSHDGGVQFKAEKEEKG